MEGFVTTVIVFCVLIAAILKMGVKIVSQSEILIIERLGRFHKVLDGGFHIIVPFFDAVRAFERARRGLFLAFQSPEEIPGITVENMIRTARQMMTGEKIKLLPFRKELNAMMEELQIDPSYAQRYLNVGFSGGEKKRSEVLQLLMLHPKLALLDETDSGLDVDAVQIVSEGVARFHTSNNACLIITHNAKILDKLQVDYVHVLAHGKIVCEGGAELVQQINDEGFTHILADQGKVG